MEDPDVKPDVSPSSSELSPENFTGRPDLKPDLGQDVSERDELDSDAEIDTKPLASTSNSQTENGAGPSYIAAVPALATTESNPVPPPGSEIDAAVSASPLAAPLVAENQTASLAPEPTAESDLAPDFEDQCYCSDCVSDDEHVSVDGDYPMHGNYEDVAVDAAAFPHIVDAIRDYALAVCPLTVRRVNRSWRRCADEHLGAHVRLDLRAPGLGINGRVELYCWEFSGATHHIPYLRRSIGPEQELRRARTDARQVARILDVHACLEFVQRPVNIADWGELHTVRLVQGRGSVSYDTAHTMPHIGRIVFSDGPYDRGLAAAFPSIEQMLFACQTPSCRVQHTRRVVCNFRSPGNSDGQDMVPIPLLPQLVLILHGWGVIPGFDPAAPHPPNHPLGEVRGLAILAALEGTHVTIVNPELVDLRTGRRACNMGDVAETLRQMWIGDIVTEIDQGDDIDEGQTLQRIEFISLQDYRERVGEDEFAIETMTDATAQVPRYS